MARRCAAPVMVALSLSCSRAGPEAFRTEPVTRGPLTEMVSATGDVEAIVTVNVGSQVSGTISKLYVDFNSKVKKGQPLADLDSRLFRAALERAGAGLAAAEATVEKSQAALHDAQRQETRILELFAQKLVSQSEVDTAASTREQDAAQLSAAKAQVLQARADRDTAATNLAFTRITSPIDGIVVSRAVDVGQTVAAALQAPTLFTIANDLTKMQILANIDEADVGKVREQQPARFTVDAYPGEVFRGTIRELRQAPTTIQNVVTYAAVIDAPNPDHKLRQGMTAAVQVTTDRHDDALRVANGALRFKPANAPDAPAGPGGGGGQRGDRTLSRAGAGGAANGGAAAGGGRRLAQESEGAAAGNAGAAGERPRGRAGRVWKLVAGKAVPVDVRVGLSDGQRSEVFGPLAEGDEIIVGEAGAAPAQAGNRRGRGPF